MPVVFTQHPFPFLPLNAPQFFPGFLRAPPLPPVSGVIEETDPPSAPGVAVNPEDRPVRAWLSPPATVIGSEMGTRSSQSQSELLFLGHLLKISGKKQVGSFWLESKLRGGEPGAAHGDFITTWREPVGKLSSYRGSRATK